MIAGDYHCLFMQGVDPILYRDPLRTPQFDSTYLNNPNFVGSFALDDHVYFFFREGKSILSEGNPHFREEKK